MGKYFKKGLGRLYCLGVSHTFAVRGQPGLQSSEDSNGLDVQWLIGQLMLGAHLGLSTGALD